ncbi:hypothetical protein BGZ76_000722 [Entomortierella beljakovae]|nr:hypothetical protein BGZ76_000722 [Entomortierella beljakovae]
MACSIDGLSSSRYLFITNVSPLLRLINLDRIENVPKNRGSVWASLRQTGAGLRHKPAKHVTMESDVDECEELKDNGEDKDKDTKIPATEISRGDCVASMVSQFETTSISVASTGMLVTLKRTVPSWCVFSGSEVRLK